MINDQGGYVIHSVQPERNMMNALLEHFQEQFLFDSTQPLIFIKECSSAWANKKDGTSLVDFIVFWLYSFNTWLQVMS